MPDPGVVACVVIEKKGVGEGGGNKKETAAIPSRIRNVLHEFV